MAHVLVVSALLVVTYLVALRESAITLPPPFTERCIVGQELNTAESVPTYVINLNDEPSKRWTKLAADYSEKINDMLTVVKNITYSFFHGKVMKFIDVEMTAMNYYLPHPYQDEIRGIATTLKVPVGQIVMFNVFYEIFAMCTSIVAEDPNGKILAGRNLDFGLLLGWSAEQHDWMLTSKLRPLVVNLEWHVNGRVLFKSANFAGFIGVLNGVKPNVFTLSANERFDWNGGYVGVMEWLLRLEDNKWMFWVTREIMEKAGSYREAVAVLKKIKLMAPIYFIVGGVDSGEGTIITRSRKNVVDEQELRPAESNGWYLLQTNSDSWKQPFYLDDRRTPGRKCMEYLGRDNLNFTGLLQVLSSPTTLNKLTVFTSIMDVDSGDIKTYIQKCPDPCWPW